MCHVVNVKCLCNTVYTQLFFFIEKALLGRHVSELIAPASGRASLLTLRYCNAFGLSLRRDKELKILIKSLQIKLEK
jgi:hypothetical protein